MDSPERDGVSTPSSGSVVIEFLTESAADLFVVTCWRENHRRSYLATDAAKPDPDAVDLAAPPSLELTLAYAEDERTILGLPEIERVEPVRSSDADMDDAGQARAAELYRHARESPGIVDVDQIIDLLSAERPAGWEALLALRHVVDERPDDCVPAVDQLRAMLDDDHLLAGDIRYCLASIAAAAPEVVAPTVDALPAYLAGPASRERRQAARTIVELAAHDASLVRDVTLALVDLLERGRADERSYTAFALARLAADCPDAVAPYLDRLVDAIDATADESTSLNLVSAVGRVADDPTVATPALSDLLDLLDAEDPQLRANAMSLLAELASADPAAVQPHFTRIGSVLSDDDPHARLHATSTVAHLAAEFPDRVGPHVDALVDLLDDDHELVRRNACRALETLGSTASEAIEALERRRDDDESEAVREAAADALAAIETETGAED